MGNGKKRKKSVLNDGRYKASFKKRKERYSEIFQKVADPENDPLYQFLKDPYNTERNPGIHCSGPLSAYFMTRAIATHLHLKKRGKKEFEKLLKAFARAIRNEEPGSDLITLPQRNDVERLADSYIKDLKLKSLADAEIAKDHVEQIFDVDAAGNAPEAAHA